MPADVLEQEKGIYRAQMENGKPANVIDKIVEGKLGSFYEQVVLPTSRRSATRSMTMRRIARRRPSQDARRATSRSRRFVRLKVGETS